MSHIQGSHFVETCPQCRKKLLKVPLGFTVIGSPLITCRRCGAACKTDLRTEWYNHPAKWTVWGIPLIVTASLLAAGTLTGEPAIGIMAICFALPILLFFTVRDIIRIILSKRRMRNPSYLRELLDHGLITQPEYDRFMKTSQS